MGHFALSPSRFGQVRCWSRPGIRGAVRRAGVRTGSVRREPPGDTIAAGTMVGQLSDQSDKPRRPASVRR
ncbi:hypothetical protein SGPA1_20195 [Streptomyces misionensis JCM 4497]